MVFILKIDNSRPQPKEEEQKSNFGSVPKSSGVKATVTKLSDDKSSFGARIEFDYGFPQYGTAPARKRSKSPKAKKASPGGFNFK